MAKAKQQKLQTTQEANNLSNEDILFAHMVLAAAGATEEYKQKANDIYKIIFNEDVKFGCCKNRSYIKLDHYVRNVIKIL